MKCFRNLKAWYILGLIYWILIAYLIFGVKDNVDALLRCVAFIPAVIRPFCLIWPTQPFRAATLVYI
jgi:hypothetical protein